MQQLNRQSIQVNRSHLLNHDLLNVPIVRPVRDRVGIHPKEWSIRAHLSNLVESNEHLRYSVVDYARKILFMLYSHDFGKHRILLDGTGYSPYKKMMRRLYHDYGLCGF